MYNKQMLKAMLHERLSETAEEIFSLFEQAVAEYQREIERLREVGQAKPMEFFTSLSLGEAQQTQAMGQDELTDSVLNEENTGHFPCEVKSEQWTVMEDESPPLNACEFQAHEQPNVKSEGPELSGGAETYNSFELEEEISNTSNYEEAFGSDAPNKSFSCPVCNKDFTQERGVKLHIRMVHTVEEPQTSAEWDQESTSQPEPGMKSSKTRTFCCTVCDKRFIKMYSLKMHLKEHAGDDLFKCTECIVTFAKEAYFIRHMSTVHSVERPFKCSVCNQSSKTTGALRTHLQIHTGERPCKCSVCGKGFVQSATLARHMITHTGEKPFCCAKCGKKYGSKQNLMIHKKITHH